MTKTIEIQELTKTYGRVVALDKLAGQFPKVLNYYSDDLPRGAAPWNYSSSSSSCWWCCAKTTPAPLLSCCYILNNGYRLPETTFTRTAGAETGQ